MDNIIDGIMAKAAWGNGGILRLKISIVCGDCQNLFTTKEYIRATNYDNQLMAPCPSCHKWNLTTLIIK